MTRSFHFVVARPWGGVLIGVAAWWPAWAQQTLERVEITGSSVRRIDAESALPVQIIRREAIERSGYTSTVDLVRNLPAVMGGTSESSAVGLESFGFAGASIHNVGETRTLVLLNGRRLSAFGGQSLTGSNNAIDLNSIPIAAIERIELLTDGASALYGSDAIAGVINFITRRSGTQGEASAGVSFPRGGARESHVSVTKGFGDADDYSVVISASADRRTSLAATERKFARSGQFYFTEGGQKYRFQTASYRSIPANVYDADYNAYNPYLQANGGCPASHFVDGTACTYDYASNVEIYPERQRQGITLSFDRQLDGRAKLFGDVVFSRSKSVSTISQTPSELVIAPGSPYFGQAVAAGGYSNADPALGDLGVLASYRFSDLGQRTNDDRAEALHMVLGFEGALAAWDYNVAYTHSQSVVRGNLADGYGYNSRVLNALNTVVNPFALPGQQTPAAQAAIAGAAYSGYWNGGKSTLDGLEARVSTELMPLAAGPLQLGSGVSAFNEHYNYQPSDLAQGLGGDSLFGADVNEVPLDASRQIYGAFIELVAPIAKGVELTAGLRHDHYSDFGSTTNAKLSGRWQPQPGVLVRGSVGTGYKAPSVFQVKAQRQNYGVTGGIVECDAPDASGVTLDQVAGSLGAQCLSGQLDVIASGNAELKPERSTQATLGVRLEPTPQFSFGADWWTVGIRDAIGQIDQNAILGDYTRYASSFTTAVSSATGQTLLALYQPNVNQGKEWRTGIDFDVTGRTRVAAGVQLTSQLNATWMLRDSYQTIEDGAYSSSLGRVGDNGAVTFRWQARWVNTLAIGAWLHTAVLNYKSGYQDYDVAAAGLADINIVNADGSIGDAVDSLQRSVSDYLSVDWQSRWQLLGSFDLNIGVLNVFDTDPPRSIAVGGANQGFQVGYDDRYYDPRGRTVYVNLIYRF